MESFELGIDVSDPYSGILIVVICLLFVAFFSSSEASLISVNKIRIRHLAEQGQRAAQAVQRVVGRHDRLFATILLSENALIIFASSVGTAVALAFLGKEGVLVASLAMTVLIVIFGEITPKTLAALHAERFALVVARPIDLIIRLLSPLIFLFTAVPNLIIRLMGGRAASHAPFVTEAELRMLIDIGEQEGTVSEGEREMLQKVFAFRDRRAREAMVPRPEIVGVDQDARVGDFLATFAESGHTRFPVYAESVDNVVGIVHIKDVLLGMAEGRAHKGTHIQELMRPTYFVPETKKLGELFTELQANRASMVIVIDEFGGTAGLLTMENLVEEIVGDLGDELSGSHAAMQPLDEHTVEIDAGMQVDEVNEELGLDLPTGDYETVAGFVLNVLGHIPQPGEQLRHGDLRLTVAEMRGQKIEKVRIARS